MINIYHKLLKTHVSGIVTWCNLFKSNVLSLNNNINNNNINKNNINKNNINIIDGLNKLHQVTIPETCVFNNL